MWLVKTKNIFWSNIQIELCMQHYALRHICGGKQSFSILKKVEQKTTRTRKCAISFFGLFFLFWPLEALMPEFWLLTVIGFKCQMKESKTGSLVAACFIMRQNKICRCQNFSQLERSLFKSRSSGVVVKFKFIILREGKNDLY